MSAETWTPYAFATSIKLRLHTCAGCQTTTRDVTGWWWRWIDRTSPTGGRQTDSLCPRCFNRVSKLLRQMPRCPRCGSTALIHDRIGEHKLLRTTCETCAFHREDPLDSLKEVSR